jgi:hypothetical protein
VAVPAEKCRMAVPAEKCRMAEKNGVGIGSITGKPFGDVREIHRTSNPG